MKLTVTVLVVRIWKLDLNDKSVLLTCMMMITSPDCSCHVSMFSSSLCMTMPNFKVLVYDVGEHSSQVKDGKTNSAKRRDEQYTLFTHHKDNDHTKEITALCSCHRLGIFATTSDDGLVKIWDTQNNLVRELTFDITLRGVCFANDRGDLLVGFQNHISFVSITSYLPLTYLGSIVEEEFSSDANEEPVPFNHSLELWFDIASLLALPIELVRRKTILDALKGLRRASGKICSGEVDANYKESQPSDSQVNTDAVPEMTSVLLIPEKTKSSTGTECFKPCRKKLNVNFLPVSSQCSIESSEDDVDDTIAYGESKGYIVVQTSDSLISIDKASNIAEAPDVDDVTEASDVDDDMEDETFKWPIAPDGYIPNSVVRKLMKIPRKDAFVDSPWKLKPLPFIESPADSLAKSSKSSEDYTTHAPFEWLSSSSESNVDLEEIMSMLSDGVGGDLDVQDLLPLSSDSDSEMATPDEVLLKRRRKTATALIQLKKKMSKRGIEGGALTMAMVVEEAKQLKKEEEERKKSEIVIERKPSIPDILTLIVKMRWFSPKKITINIFSVTNALVALLDRVGDSIHGEVCKCIVDIHSGIGFNESLMDKVLSNLLKQVSSDRAPLRCNVVKTMASLGDNRNKVIMGILPLTIDLVLEVKVAAIEALKKLNGLTSKEQLMNYLANTGVIQPYVNEDRNVVKKIFSKKSAGIQKLSKFRDRNLPKNLTDLQSPVGKVDGWLATLTDEFEEEEQFEKSVNKKKKKEDKKEEMKNMKESEDLMELIPPQIKETMHHEQHNEVKQRRILPQNNQKRKPTLTSEVEKLPAIKKNEIKREKTFFVPDSCFGAEQVHKKVTPTVRRKTMHAQILEAKKYSLYLEKKRMEQTMNQRMEAHRKHYDKILRKQRKGKQVRRFLPTSSAFYKYFFDSDCKRRGKHVYTKQPDVSMSEMNSDWMIAKCATLPRIHEQEDDNESSLRLNCQFSVVLDKGVQKHLEIESGIEDSLTCSKLSLSGGQKVGTQYSSGFFSSHEIENLKQNNTQDKTKQDVFNNSTELDRPKKLYLSSSLLQSLRKRPQIPVEEPDFIDGRQRVVYEAKTLPIERAVFPLRMTNKIMFTKEPSNTVAEWDIMRCKGKSTFGVLEMSWSLVRSKDLSESDRHRRSVREEKKRH
ncbi:uncharacterized protein [Antedon mediterranea]|uniref:uncharacterized protein n=1 Tax=Antedon mediterranea TaxID=105859 RepID=UPI003AF5077F